MFYVSLVLVIVAAVTLVIGLLSSGLPLVIVSIASSFAAGVFLILTVVRDRPQLTAAAGEEAAGEEEEAEVEPGEAEEVEFPIADYDDLKVSEIVPLLPELDDDELEDVREREAAGKGRTTVLGRIDELLGGGDAAESDAFPIADYDELNVGEVASVLDDLTEVELEVVRSYEKKNKARKGVLSKIDAELNRR